MDKPNRNDILEWLTQRQRGLYENIEEIGYGIDREILISKSLLLKELMEDVLDDELYKMICSGSLVGYHWERVK